MPTCLSRRLVKILYVTSLLIPAAFSQSGFGSPSDVKPAALQSYANVPLAFEPNEGQAAADVRFLSRARDLTVLLKDREATLIVPSAPKGLNVAMPLAIHMQFVGAVFSHKPAAMNKQQGISNYLLGSAPAKWHTSIPNFGRVRYSGIYPGVDLTFYGNHRMLEHDFIVAPYADYHQIQVRLDGAISLSEGPKGCLLVATSSGSLTLKPPDVYQYRGNRRIPVEAQYSLAAANEFRFELGTYDKTLPLVIDPVLTYSTYLAGTNTDSANAIAVDSAGNSYVTGYTLSTDFPVLNAEQPTCNNVCSQPDAFVTKLNATGSALVYSTYVGGSAYDQANAIAVDSAGNALVAGYTNSFDFPQKNGTTVILGAYANHGFAFSLNATGSAFNFSTYLGGEAGDAATGIASDASRNVYVSGYTGSANFPVTTQIGPPPGSFKNDIFLTKFSPAGAMDFSTVIGGTSTNSFGTFAYATNISLAVNSLGQAYLAGAAFDGFPTTPQAYHPSYVGNGQTNAFLGLLNAGGTAFLYGTYLGGTGGDSASQLALDSPGNVYVTGTTGSLDFPTTTGAFQITNLANGQVAFVTKLDSGLSTLVYSTYLGPTQSNFGSVHATAIAIDASGNSYVVGYTNAQSFPLVSPIVTTLGQNFRGPASSAFLSVLNSSGSALTFSTFFTGSVGTSGTGVALDSSGNPYITGTTSDPDLPTTAGAFQATIPPPPNPVQHAFVTKFSVSTPSAGACLTASDLNFGSVEPGKSSFPYPVTLTNCGTVGLKITSMVISNPVFVMSRSCKNLAASASCTFYLRYNPTVAGTDAGTLQINDNAPITPQKIQLIGFSAFPYLQIYTSGLNAPDEIVGATTAPFLAQVSNADGILPIHITSVTATGDFAGVNQCPKVLYPGQVCNLGATFTPSATGTRSGTLSIYDDAVGSPQTLPLTGNGLSSYPTPVITYTSPSSALVGSTPVRVALQGTGFFPASTVTVNGKAITARSSYPEELEITLGGLKQVRNLSIQVTNPAPGGASAAVGFSVYSQTALGAADVIYEPYTQKFYASIPAASASNPNTLETIDPVTGLIGSPIAIGNDPGALGLSSDGTMLYVGLNGDHAVIPFNLRTQKAGTEIPLGSDPQRGPLTASTLQVSPATQPIS